ncbi:hypothetical protein C8R47DRAFT_989101, partial [Mycena vitilis]
RCFICSVEGCGKRFRRKEHLKRHVRETDNNLPTAYGCLHKGCSKTFSRRDNLAQHSRDHLLR